MSKDIAELLPIVREKAAQLIGLCKTGGIDILVTSTYRSIQEQDEIYAQGRTKPGAIISNAKGGQSFHNWRVAFDVVPLVGGKATWDDHELWERIGKIGEVVGLEWGGRWTGFVDKPHFQFTQGYSYQDFIDGKVDPKKFQVEVKDVVITPPVTSQNDTETTKQLETLKGITADIGEDTRPIYKSASKVVFISIALATCVALFTGEISQENFMLLATGAFSYYFANKSS